MIERRTSTTCKVTIILLVFLLSIQIQYNMDEIDGSNVTNGRATEILHDSTDDFVGTQGNLAVLDGVIVEEGGITLSYTKGLWTQDNWSGGPGQDHWSDPTKYDTSSDINVTPSGGIELLKDVRQEWDWTQLNGYPEKRGYHTAVWDPVSDQMLVYGGRSAWSTYTNTVLAFDPISGTWASEVNGMVRSTHAAVWDDVNDQMVAHGGTNGTSSWSTNESLDSYDPFSDTWTHLNNTYKRQSHSAVWDSMTHEMIIFGGSFGWSTHYNTTLGFNTSNGSWVTHKPAASERRYHSAAMDDVNRIMYIFGGWAPSASNELLAYDLNTDSWTSKTPGGATRYGHSAIWDTLNNRMLVFGGYSGGWSNQVIEYDPVSNSWTPLTPTNTPPQGRYYHSAVWNPISNEMIIFGGLGSSSSYLNDTWSFGPVLKTLFSDSGTLISSTYSTPTTGRLEKLSWEPANQPTECGATCLRLQIAASDTSNPSVFIGPDGTSASYFTYSGDTIPESLIGKKYLRYKVFFQTADNGFSPRLDHVSLNFTFYDPSGVYISPIVDAGSDATIREFLSTYSLPENTTCTMEISSSDFHDMASQSAWVDVQDDETLKNIQGRYFQYRITLETSVTFETPRVDSVTIKFNNLPAPPELSSPYDGTWVNVSRPTFKWEFVTFNSSNQDSFSLELDDDISFDTPDVTSGSVESTSEQWTPDRDIPDGIWYWRVKARDSWGGWSGWSESRSLGVDTHVPDPPILASETHPDQSKYYFNGKVNLTWSIENELIPPIGYSYTLDNEPGTVPNNISDTNEKEISLILQSDGIHYFHVRARDIADQWGMPAHYRINIDTTPPLIEDRSDGEGTTGDPLVMRAQVSDLGSGSDNGTLSWRFKGDAQYQKVPLLLPSGLNDSHLVMLETTFDIPLGSDRNIEYFFEVPDRTNPANMGRLPMADSKELVVRDNDAPEILKVTGDVRNVTVDSVTIEVVAEDNIGVIEANIYLDGLSIYRKMEMVYPGLFTTNISMSEGAIKRTYWIDVMDAEGNNASTPQGGEFVIEVEAGDGGDGDGTDGDGTGDSQDSDDKDDEGLSTFMS